METSFCRSFVDLAAISRNFKRLGSAAKLIPVIKSDAYGHGIIQVAQTLSASGAVFIAASTVRECLGLRAAGIEQKLLALLGGKDVEEMTMAKSGRITPVIYNEKTLAMAKQAAGEGDCTQCLDIAIKFNTGMARLGFNPEEADSVIDSLRNIPGLRPALLMTHLACADCPEEDAFTNRQADAFSAIAEQFKNTFTDIKTSLPASAGILRGYAERCDFGRAGIAIYGGNPLAGSIHESLGRELETAMSIGTPILQLRSLRAGQTVSYGRAFKAPKDMRVAVLSIGYADGYSRRLSGKGQVAVGKGRAKVLGRVCMGMIVVDITEIPDADKIREGDMAFILGGAGCVEQPVSINELAEAYETISYEVFCLLGRNQHEYK